MLFTPFSILDTTRAHFIAMNNDYLEGGTRLKQNKALLLSKHCAKLFIRLLPVNEWLMNMTQAILNSEWKLKKWKFLFNSKTSAHGEINKTILSAV